MGVAAADLDGDGRPDLLVTNLYLEGTTLYQNLGAGMFADRSAASGILAATRYLLGFGIAAIDAGNDGRLDVVITNGNVNDFRPLYPFKMPTRLYEGRPGGRLVDVSDQAGPPWSVARLGRGLAAGDLDNDGRPDFVIMVQNEPLAYFHNQTERAGHFVTFRLEGTDSNRDGVGARVVVNTVHGPPGCATRRGWKLPLGRRRSSPLRSRVVEHRPVRRSAVAFRSCGPLEQPGRGYRIFAPRGRPRGQIPARLQRSR